MAELLSAGVFIEERQTDAQVVEAVSTSNMGIVGFSPRGPTDRARLVTSLDEYFRVFGNLTKKSLMGSQVLAFFQNGGRRCFVVRVVPSDAVLADAQVQTQMTSQLIETGDGAATVYSKTSATSGLIDNGGLTPLVPSSISFKYRAAGTAVPAGQQARNDGSTAPLTAATAVAAYSGRVDPKATLMVVGASSPNGDIYFRSISDGNTAITIAVVVDPGTVARSIVVAGNAITINPATTVGVVNGTETATAIAAAVNADPSASALVSATAQGTGAALVAAFALASLKGIPVFDKDLMAIIPGTLTISWFSASVAKSIAVVAVTTPTASTTNGAGSKITIDWRNGRFSLLTDATETPVLADNGTFITFAYTPASATVTITADVAGGIESATGKFKLSGSTLVAPTYANNFVNVIDGSYTFTFTAGPTNIPHNKSPLVATYKANAWDLYPISKGAWANDVRLKVVGNVEAYVTATASYTSHNVTVQLRNTDTGVYEPVEQYEEVSFTNSDAPSFFPEVLNELSDFVNVSDSGIHLAVRQLDGYAYTSVVSGGNNAAAGVTVKTVVDVSLPGAPIAPRTVSITYLKASDSSTLTITDDGNGNLIGSVNPAYAATSTSGLGPNKINYTTGEVNFQTASPARAGEVVLASFYTAPEESAHYELFGDTTKAYSYTYNAVLYSYYTAGSDGTFTSTTFSRSQFTEPSLQASTAGMYAFDRIDEILQIVIPDFAGDATVSQDQITYAEQRATLPHGGDRFIILTVPAGSSSQEAVDWVRFTLNVRTKYAAVYWPWVKFRDPLNNNRPTTTPPLGHIAGIYARTDSTKNVGKAPAGTVDGQILGITGLEQDPTQGMRDFVYPYRVNPLISTPQTGRAVWGSRTLSAISEWKNINAVRLFMFCEKAIYNSTFWTVFENNGPALWARIKAQLSGFLDNLFNDGYFAGRNATEAFFVIVDDTNNSATTINQGQVIIDVGLAPNKPAEYVRFRLQQITST